MTSYSDELQRSHDSQVTQGVPSSRRANWLLLHMALGQKAWKKASSEPPNSLLRIVPSSSSLKVVFIADEMRARSAKEASSPGLFSSLEIVDCERPVRSASSFCVIPAASLNRAILEPSAPRVLTGSSEPIEMDAFRWEEGALGGELAAATGAGRGGGDGRMGRLEGVSGAGPGLCSVSSFIAGIIAALHSEVNIEFGILFQILGLLPYSLCVQLYSI